ncbi:MAG: CAP domain-containing protein [Cyanobacteria bacterium P01_D01_bin.44]
MKNRHLFGLAFLSLVLSCVISQTGLWQGVALSGSQKAQAQSAGPELSGIVYVVQNQSWREATIRGAVGQSYGGDWIWSYDVQYLDGPGEIESGVATTRIRSLDQATAAGLTTNTYTLSSQAGIDKALEAHNQERRSLNLPELSWSAELAVSAEDWAEILLQRDRLEHSPADLRNNGTVGENLTSLQSSAPGGAYSTPERAIGRWLDERNFYDYAANACIAGQQCYHYTQIIWAETTAVGCGVARTQDATKEVWVCQYSPGGNVIGQRPY